MVVHDEIFRSRSGGEEKLPVATVLELCMGAHWAETQNVRGTVEKDRNF
jgi:hypothetical protein